MGIPKQHRLKRRKDFSAVYQRGTRFKAKHFSLGILRRSPKTVVSSLLSTQSANPSVNSSATTNLFTRIGISISLKVDKRAVVRNRIRRQIQAAFRQLLHRIKSNLDIVVIVYPSAIQCDYLQFLQELEQLLADAEVLHGGSGECVL